MIETRGLERISGWLPKRRVALETSRWRQRQNCGKVLHGLYPPTTCVRTVTAHCGTDVSQRTRRRVLLSFKALLTRVLFASFWPDSLQAEPLPLAEAQYDKPGPFQTAKLPKLEHTCTNCFPLCVGDRCLIRIQVIYPKISLPDVQPPYPLAIITSGFLVKSEAYASYAERLASWGYAAVLYDKVESLMESLDDVTSKNVVHDIIDWARTDPLMQRISDANSVYLIGHSRGGKISVLAAAEDTRIRSLCLIDPVDNTVYAPLGPGYPSAVEALNKRFVQIPLLAIGSEFGSADCAPADANFRRFYEAATGVAAEVVIHGSGHFQFLDNPSAMQRAICAVGTTDDVDVRRMTQALMITWGQSTVRHLSSAMGSTSIGSTAQEAYSATLLQTLHHIQVKQPPAVRYKNSAAVRCGIPCTKAIQ